MGISKFTITVLLGFLLTSCAKSSYIVTASSTISNEDAVRSAQSAISKAEASGCRARSIGSGAGVGVLIGDDCIECANKQKERKAGEGRGTVVVIHVLMECPLGTNLSGT